MGCCASVPDSATIKNIRKHLNHKLQTNPWHHEAERHNHHETPGRQTKQSNQLSLPHQDDCKTRIDKKFSQQNVEQLQNPTMGLTINNNKATALERTAA